MVSGILPVTGDPLPLMSYGGTAVISMLAEYGDCDVYSYPSLIQNLSERWCGCKLLSSSFSHFVALK